MSEMNKSSVINGQPVSSLAKIAGGHAHSGRITDSLHRRLLFSTPLLGRRGLNIPARQPDNDCVQFTGRTWKISSRHGTLRRSLSMNAKSRRNVAVNRTHVGSADARKSSCLLPSNGADSGARLNVSENEFLVC